jgi:hypothetical protein
VEIFRPKFWSENSQTKKIGMKILRPKNWPENI